MHREKTRKFLFYKKISVFRRNIPVKILDEISWLFRFYKSLNFIFLTYFLSEKSFYKLGLCVSS
jgi:hypothetical protein